MKIPTPSEFPTLTMRRTTMLLAMLVLAACASAPSPATTSQMALAQAALTNAVGAGSVSFAPAETALARDKFTRATAALGAGRNDEALMLAEQVQVDARVAETKAEAEKARRSSVSLQEASRVLREEMARQPR